MLCKEVTLANAEGFHMRPAGAFAKEMEKFVSDVTLITDDRTVNGKSLMNIMAAGIKGGSLITVRCEGPDEAEALARAADLIENGLKGL